MERIIDKWTKQELEEIVKSSKTMTQVCNKIGYSTFSTSNWKVITETFKNLGIEKLKTNNNFIRYEEEKVFCKNSQVSQKCVRTHFIKKVPMNQCALCHNPPQWQGKPLTLRLDHINGIHNDNRLENLRWLCPNCDSQLDTYCGRNQKDKKIKNYCIDCGTEISKNAIRCVNCQNIQQQITDRPSREELKNLIRILPFTKIGEMYNVSDNAIRKWCDSYNLPRTKKQIRSYFKEEWDKI